MPTIFRKNGYRFYFVSFDGSEPIHVHVSKDSKEAKIWLMPVKVAWSQFSAVETRKIIKEVSNKKKFIYATWEKHFGTH